MIQVVETQYNVIITRNEKSSIPWDPCQWFYGGCHHNIENLLAIFLQVTELVALRFSSLATRVR